MKREINLWTPPVAGSGTVSRRTVTAPNTPSPPFNPERRMTSCFRYRAGLESTAITVMTCESGSKESEKRTVPNKETTHVPPHLILYWNP